MAKPNPLAKGLESLAKPAPVAESNLQSAAANRSASARTSSRDGQTLIGGFFDPLVHKQLKVLAAESSQTQQELIAEALNMIFAKYGKPEIAMQGRLPRPEKS